MARPLLQVGSSGDYVTALQEFLSELGYDINVDGIFGDETQQAVMAFQEEYGESYEDIDVDGIVGPDTWALIDAVSEETEEDEGEEA